MREFKFRVWNTCTKRMCDNEYLEETVRNISKIKNIQGLFLPTHEDNIVMQYTGINDINGKEIYEGDIIKIKNMDLFDNSLFIGKVEFYDGSYVVDNKNKSKTLFREIDELFILGNIYENPELLD